MSVVKIVVEGVPDGILIVEIFVAVVEESLPFGTTDLVTPLAVELMELVILAYHLLEFRFSHVNAACLPDNVLEHLSYILYFHRLTKLGIILFIS